MPDTLVVFMAMMLVSIICIIAARRFFKNVGLGALAAAFIIGLTFMIAPDCFLSISWWVLYAALTVAYILGIIFVFFLLYALVSGRGIRDCLGLGRFAKN